MKTSKNKITFLFNEEIIKNKLSLSPRDHLNTRDSDPLINIIKPELIEEERESFDLNPSIIQIAPDTSSKVNDIPKS